jgi:hypothetical protein
MAQVYASSGDCVKKRCVEVDLPQLRPGCYMVVCATFAAGQLGPFQLQVFCNSTAVGVDQFYPPTWRTQATAIANDEPPEGGEGGGEGGGGADVELAED